MERFSGTAFTFIFLIIGVTVQTVVYGQTDVLEEVIVTAQKREQSLNEVPISVNVISGDSIEKMNIDRLQDFTAQIPSLNIAESATGDQIFLRGVGSAVNPGFEQSVGTFVDGVYKGRDAQSRARLLDVERIEVLRGPQSIYFGNNSIGGALNITTRNPGDEFQGYVRGMYGTDEDYEFTAALGGPVTDTFGARAAIRWSGYDGFIENQTRGRDEDQQENFAGRITAVWTPSEGFDATLKAEYTDFHQDGVAKEAGLCPPEPPFAGPQLTCARALALSDASLIPPFEDEADEVSHRGSVFVPRGIPGAGPPNNPVHPNAEIALEEFVDLKSTTFGLTLNWDMLDDHTITSISAYTGYELDRATDIDNLPVAAAGIHDPADWDQYSQELRFASPTGGRFEYIAGLYYQHGELFSDEIFVFPLALNVQSNTLFDQEEDAVSAFGAFTWHFTDALRGTIGLRYTEVEKDLLWTQSVSSTAAGDPRTVPGDPAFDNVPNFGKVNSPPTLFSRSDDDLNPSINVQYDVNDNFMAYASFAQGFKAGGFDQRADTVETFDDVSFGPEEVDAYEIGAKTSWLDGRLQLNLAAFRMEYTDLQVSSLGPSGVTFVVTNAASAISQGLELDARWAVGQGFIISTALAYLDAYFDEWKDGPCNAIETAIGVPSCLLSPATNDRSGDDLPFAPDFSGNVTLDHHHEFGNGMRLNSQVVMLFTTEVLHRIDNDPRLVENGYVKLDARVELAQGPWSVAVVGKNLTDEVTYNLTNRLVGSSGSIYRQRDRDRHFLLQVQYNF